MQLPAVSLRSFISCRELASVSRSIQAEARSPPGEVEAGMSGKQLGENLLQRSFKVLPSYSFSRFCHSRARFTDGVTSNTTHEPQRAQHGKLKTLDARGTANPWEGGVQFPSGSLSENLARLSQTHFL